MVSNNTKATRWPAVQWLLFQNNLMTFWEWPPVRSSLWLIFLKCLVLKPKPVIHTWRVQGVMIFQSLFAFPSSFISVAQGSVFRNFPRKTAHARCCGTFIQFIIDVLNVEYIRYIYKILLHYWSRWLDTILRIGIALLLVTVSRPNIKKNNPTSSDPILKLKCST